MTIRTSYGTSMEPTPIIPSYTPFQPINADTLTSSSSMFSTPPPSIGHMHERNKSILVWNKGLSVSNGSDTSMKIVESAILPPSSPPSENNGEGGDRMRSVKIADLMQTSGTGFGTSGVRGLVTDLTDQVCYIYTLGFLQYLKKQGALNPGNFIAIAGDLRDSTGRIMRAVGKAITDSGYRIINGGHIPSPAIAFYGIKEKMPSIMITGSHIPDDRNGIKYNKISGEILKHDEAGIKEQVVQVPDSLFDSKGSFVRGTHIDLPNVHADVQELFIQRYLNFFTPFLEGKKIGLYAHSAVGKTMLKLVLEGLGAEVEVIGISKRFIPVDTEAIRDEDVQLARNLAGQYFALVSTDGDSDRPLIAGTDGIWLRGDVLGIIVSKFFNPDSVATPVSCNTMLERCNSFTSIVRTKIGSPYVIAAMDEARSSGAKRIVSYEANGGYLTATEMSFNEKILAALPTRDSFLPILVTLWRAVHEQKKVEDLVAELPQRFTSSDRLKNFPLEKSRAILAIFNSGNAPSDIAAVEHHFGPYFGAVHSTNTLDGVRIIFASEEIVHLRPSGNAPEFRCYTEASSASRAHELNKTAMDILKTFL